MEPVRLAEGMHQKPLLMTVHALKGKSPSGLLRDCSIVRRVA